MADQQPKALRLAEWLQSGADDPMWSDHTEMPKSVAAHAAAELRRLHQSEREGWRYADELERGRKRLESINAQLLEALERLVNDDEYWDAMANARAAIEAVHNIGGKA